MSGCCQVTIPLGVHEKLPVSVSFIARQGGDHFLLDTVQTMYPSLKEQVDVAMKSNILNSRVSKEQSAEIAKEKGNIAYTEKHWQKAVNLYTEAIKLNEKNATYYSNRAAAYLELGSYLQAEADCNKAISIEKKNVKVLLKKRNDKGDAGLLQRGNGSKSMILARWRVGMDQLVLLDTMSAPLKDSRPLPDFALLQRRSLKLE